MYAHEVFAATICPVNPATKQDGWSPQCSRCAALSSARGPILQLWRDTAPPASCTCRLIGQRSRDSLLGTCVYGCWVLQASCALALLGSWGTASRSVCCFPPWCCGESGPELHSVCDPTVPKLDADPVQRSGAWLAWTLVRICSSWSSYIRDC